VTITAKAEELLRLHTDPELLVVVNVWDAITAKVVADRGSRALATASHSIAATLGYPDGEKIPRDLMIDMVGRIAAAVDIPVTADLESGYGDPGETVRRAIGVGVVGANLEDRMQPPADSVAAVRAAVAAGEAEGVPFVLNARTDAFLKAGDRDPAEVLADAVERGRAFLAEGAACVFVPGKLDEQQVTALVEGIGERRVSTIGVPGSLPPARLAELGVARVSYGPFTQRAALTHLADLTTDLLAGGRLPDSIRPLN
jgi:2-methylisocitrate lyase-like PEP mutase family enzyme